MLRYGLEKKKAFHDEKKVNFLSPKNESFPKGLTHGIGQKIQIFSRLFFEKTDLEIMLTYGLKRNKAFQNSKNVNFVKSKKWVFSKGVYLITHGFGQNIENFF